MNHTWLAWGLLFLGVLTGCNLGGSEWRTALDPQGKKAFDTRAFTELAPAYFGAPAAELVKASVFDRFVYQMPRNSLYVVLAQAPQLDSLDCEVLLRMVGAGNQVLIAANELPPVAARRLGVAISSVKLARKDQNRDTVLVHAAGGGLRFRFPKKRVNTLLWQALPGENYETRLLAVDEREKALMVEAKSRSGGGFLLIAEPEWLTNYHLMLPAGKGFAEWALSRLPPPERIYIDAYYYKKQPAPPRPEVRPTPLAYILSQPGLREAFWLALLGALVYLALSIQRKQRVIPIIPPKTNSSLEFAATIGRLYYRAGNHRHLAEKRYRAWFDHLRTHYRLAPPGSDLGAFVHLAAIKTGAGESLLMELAQNYRRLGRTTAISPEELTEISSLIDQFYSALRSGSAKTSLSPSHD